MTQSPADLCRECHLLFAITSNHLTDSERPSSLFDQINRTDVTVQTSGQQHYAIIRWVFRLPIGLRKNAALNKSKRPTIRAQIRQQSLQSFGVVVPEWGIDHRDCQIEFSGPTVRTAIPVACEIGRNDGQCKRQQVPCSRGRGNLLSCNSLFQRPANRPAHGIARVALQYAIQIAGHATKVEIRKRTGNLHSTFPSNTWKVSRMALCTICVILPAAKRCPVSLSCLNDAETVSRTYSRTSLSRPSPVAALGAFSRMVRPMSKSIRRNTSPATNRSTANSRCSGCRFSRSASGN